MLQRIQSIWIGLAVLASMFLYITTLDIEVFNTNVPYVSVLCFIVGVLGILSIFSFKNRKRQILLNNLNIMINALLIGLLTYWLLNLSGGISIPEKGIEPIFPLLAIVFLVLANKNIRKDDRLVKSVDRLR